MTKTRKVCFGLVGLLALLALVLVPGVSGFVLAAGLGLGLVGTTITENSRISDVLLFEGEEDVNFIRDAVVLVSGTAACVVGQVLGEITIGTATSATKSGGNTGTGTLAVDGTAPVQANAIAGIYQVRVVSTGLYQVTDPKGLSLGEATFASGGTSTWTDRIKFLLTDNASTHFVAGDGFDVTVAVGSGKYTQVTPAAVDGSAVACAVLLQAANPASADVTAVAVTRPPAIFKSTGLVWTSGMTTPQKTTATAQLQALGMPTRTAVGA